MGPQSISTILVSRLLQGILVVFVVISVVFLVSRLARNPVEYLTTDETTVEEKELLKEQLGLTGPIGIQYVKFLWNAVQLDLGNSFISARPALSEVSSRASKTLQLGAAALIFSLALGVPLGIIAALNRATPTDWLARFLAVLGQAVPNFWLGLILIFFFAVQLDLMPTGGSGGIEHLVLPTITLGLLASAVSMRLTRSGMIDVMGTDFVRTARAKGLRESTIIWRHALRHALLPVATILGIQVGYMIAGTVIVEQVFAWPGIGRLMLHTILVGDFPVMIAGILVISTSIVVANILVDLSYPIIDPRIRAGSR
ncbi:MAG: ABC transporter permease [Chloroflexi bacterium]|nr:ABC transporter permease [Chloroflexota bacterium]MCY3589651.1 ABC transporter permease [Chloroflexota bacterium]MCY3687147.1 ABC transporter permease [Chloroflexota bacterium]MDE2709964.1 ABC transporter permease [Chloroflexota bacterium]MDE2987525.1 ABC transporter permease [Chloroflexota bacterium]